MRALSLVLALAVTACHGDPVGASSSDAAAGSGGAAGSDAAADTGTGGSAGAAGAPAQPVVLAQNRNCPVDLRVVGGTLVWADQGSAQNGTTDGVISTMPAAGCGEAGSCIGLVAAAQQSPTAVELDPASNTVYWATFLDGTIWSRASLATPQAFATGQNGPRWLAIDDTALYWTNNGSFATADGEVRRQYLDGGTPGGIAIVSALWAPVAITVFGTNIFFSSDGDSDATGYLTRAEITGQNASQLAKNQTHPRGLAVDASYVYWANMGDGSINRAKHDGSEPTVLFSGRKTPSDIAVDAQALYWVEAGTGSAYTDGAVMAAKLGQSEITPIATGQLDPRRIVLDTDNVYWLDRGTQGVDPCTHHDGSVMRAPKPW